MEKIQELEQEEITRSFQPKEFLDLTTNYEEKMTPEAKQQIQILASKIDIKSRDFVLNYGIEQQTKFRRVADAMLSSRDSKEMSEVSKLLNEAMEHIRNYNRELDGNKESIIKRIFSNSKKRIEEIRENYKIVDKKMEIIVPKLLEKKLQLSKVYDDFNFLFDSNKETFEYLTMVIHVGEIAQKEAEEKLEEMRQNGNIAPQDIRNFSDDINMFNERLQDLKLTRIISNSLAHQIRSVQQNAKSLERSILNMINTLIPLWKTQMALALGIKTVQSALDTKNNINNVANQMFLAVSQAGRDLSIETAKASQMGMIDIETIRIINQNLIQALTESTKIATESMEKRKQEEIELQQLETSLFKVSENNR